MVNCVERHKTWNTPSWCQYLGVVLSYVHFNKVMEVRWVGARISYRSIMYNNDKSVVHSVLNLSYTSHQCNEYAMEIYTHFRLCIQIIDHFFWSSYKRFYYNDILIWSFFLQIHYFYIFFFYLPIVIVIFFYFNKTLFLFHVQIILKSTLFLALGIFLTWYTCMYI